MHPKQKYHSDPRLLALTANRHGRLTNRKQTGVPEVRGRNGRVRHGRMGLRAIRQALLVMDRREELTAHRQAVCAWEAAYAVFGTDAGPRPVYIPRTKRWDIK